MTSVLAASVAEGMTVLPATAIETEAELPFAGVTCCCGAGRRVLSAPS